MTKADIIIGTFAMDNFFKLIIKKPEGNQAYSLGAFLVDVAFVI